MPAVIIFNQMESSLGDTQPSNIGNELCHFSSWSDAVSTSVSWSLSDFKVLLSIYENVPSHP